MRLAVQSCTPPRAGSEPQRLERGVGRMGPRKLIPKVPNERSNLEIVENFLCAVNPPPPNQRRLRRLPPPLSVLPSISDVNHWPGLFSGVMVPNAVYRVRNAERVFDIRLFL